MNGELSNPRRFTSFSRFSRMFLSMCGLVWLSYALKQNLSHASTQLSWFEARVQSWNVIITVIQLFSCSCFVQLLFVLKWHLRVQLRCIIITSFWLLNSVYVNIQSLITTGKLCFLRAPIYSTVSCLKTKQTWRSVQVWCWIKPKFSGHREIRSCQRMWTAFWMSSNYRERGEKYVWEINKLFNRGSNQRAEQPSAGEALTDSSDVTTTTMIQSSACDGRSCSASV